VLFELKAINALTEVESAQVLHSLKATGFGRALLINFATPRLDSKRFIQSGNHLRKSVEICGSPAVSALLREAVRDRQNVPPRKEYRGPRCFTPVSHAAPRNGGTDA
jgi:hypothetical protein